MASLKKQRYNFTISPAVKTAAANLACQRNTTLSALIESLLAREVAEEGQTGSPSPKVGAQSPEGQ